MVGRRVGRGRAAAETGWVDGVGDVGFLTAAAAEGVQAAHEDGEEDEAADTGSEADDEGLVLVDPVFDFVADRCTLADALGES